MSLDNSLPERILIYGNAGCGKTDLMTELAWKDSPYKVRFLAVDPNCPIGVRAAIARRGLQLAQGQIAVCSILDQSKSNNFKGGGKALFGKARSSEKDASVIAKSAKVDLEAESKSVVANGRAVVGRQQDYLYNALSHFVCKLKCHVVV